MSTSLQNFYKATITRTWSATTGDFNVSVKPTTSSGWLVVSPNNSTLREIIYFSATGTNGFGDFVTVSNIAHRGIGGTSAQTHSIGEAVRMNITAEHWAEMQDDIDSIVAAGLPAGTLGDVMYHDGADWVSEDFNNLLTEDKIRTATVTLSSAEILALHTTPKTLLAAPGAGKINVIDEIIFSFTAGTQYANGNDLWIKYSTASAAVGNILVNYIGNAIIVSASSSIGGYYPQAQNPTEKTILTAGTNDSVHILGSNATPFITGTGTAKIFIKYRIITL